MWPDWSAWTWWAIATAMLPLFAVPTLYDKWKARQPTNPGVVRRALAKIEERRALTDHAVWKQDRGRGDLAAKFIATAPNFGKAVEIYNDCRYDAQPRELVAAIDAMADRLHTEGRTDETMQFLGGEDLGGNYELAVQFPPKEDKEDNQYTLAVVVFQNMSKEQ